MLLVYFLVLFRSRDWPNDADSHASEWDARSSISIESHTCRRSWRYACFHAMLKPSPYLCVLATGLLLLPEATIAASAAQPTGQTASLDRLYQPDGEPWFVVIPQGWIRADGSLVTDLNAAARARYGERAPQYTAAFVSDPEDGSYALLQIQPGMPPGASYADIRTGFDVAPANMQGDMTDQSIAQVLKTMKFGESTLDTARNRVVRGLEVTQPDGKKLNATTVSYLGASKVVSLHCYAPADAFTAKQPAFQELFDGFQFKPGESFVPGVGLGTGFSYARIMLGGIVGLVGGVAAAAVMISMKKRKREGAGAGGG